MTQRIFISHSKEDRQLIEAISQVFVRTGLSMITEYFENLGAPAADQIKQDIANSKAVVVLLGPGVEKKGHTMSWVAWEVGVASQAGKDIWVLEDMNSPSSVSLPNLTDYVVWNSEDENQLRELRDIMKDEFGSSQGGKALGGAILGGLLGHVFTPGPAGTALGAILGASLAQQNQEKPPQIECPHCFQTFNLRTNISEFKCPTCRKSIKVERKQD